MKRILILSLLIVSLLSIGFISSAADDAVEIAIIVKSVNSEFWQNMLDGGEQFDKENENVNVTPYGLSLIHISEPTRPY